MAELDASLTGQANAFSDSHTLAPPQAQLRVYRSAAPRPFNGFLRPRDPADLLGQRLSGFDVSSIVTLGRDTVIDPDCTRDDIYEAVETALRSSVPGRVTYEVVDYSDVRRSREPARRYIVAQLTTERETTLTTLFRCFVTSNSLYLAATSYRLGPIRWTRVAIQASITLFVLLASLLSLLPALLSGPFGVLLLVPLILLVGAYIGWAWSEVIRAWRAGDVKIGLRNRYPKPLVSGSFDTDDTLRFLKLVMPVMLTAVLDELAIRGLVEENELDVLRDIRDKVRTSSLNINNYGGKINFDRSNVGGTKNMVGG